MRLAFISILRRLLRPQFDFLAIICVQIAFFSVISGPATAGPGSQVTKGFRHGRFLTPGFTPLKLKLKLNSSTCSTKSSTGARRAGGVVQSWTSVRTGVLASRASVRDLVRGDRKTMEEARSARCPKEQIQRGHADVAERRAG